ncbi:MAG: hypothetical protein RLZ17_121 [Actinomycetota bacterium]|jgi:hypothetical protein
MTGFNQIDNQNDDSKNIDSSKSRSKFIDVNPVEITGEIARPPFISSTEEVNKSSLRNIINAVDFPGSTGTGEATDGANATVRLRSDYTLVEDSVIATIPEKKRRSKSRFFR